MGDVLEKLKLSVGAFGEDRGAEWLHDLLDGDAGACELVFCGTGRSEMPIVRTLALLAEYPKKDV